MSSYVSEELWWLVAARAEFLCEYCLIHEDDAFYGCQVDHIISLKHGGPTDADNLAFACAFCNRRKGSDVGSVYWETGEFIRFFNPRVDRWADHFRLNGAIIEPLTAIGEVTARILGLNNGDRVLEREALMAVGKYPRASALARMVK
jgi:hypothetical protein